jgi:hypothetical protein
MYDQDLIKHAGEFQSAISSLKFERMEDGGLFFPAQKAIASGVYHTRTNGGAWDSHPNLLPTEGLTYLLSLLGAGSKLPTWYITLYSGAVTPAAGWVAATVATTATEITSNTEGYSQTTRRTWTPGTAAAAAIDNNASAAGFTIATASSVTVNGIFMISEATKGGTTGTLLSASRFSGVKTFTNTDTFDVKYGVALTSS